VKTVALKDIKTGGFTMMQLTGFGTISSDNREDYGTRVSLGNVKTSLDLKESRIVTLEDDKVVKDSKIATLESDKNDKDTRVAALESDKNSKDSKISDIESDITSLTSRVSTLESSEVDTSDLATKVSLGNVRVSLGSLATRVSSLETLGISGISNAVSWTNLTEINLSGEKITNGDFSSVTGGVPTNWVLQNGTLDADQLALGRVDGVNGAVAIQQMFSSPLAIGTKIIVKVERYDTNTGNAGFRLVKADGNIHGNVVQIPPSTGFVEYTVADHAMAGIRLDTLHGTRSISSISVFQGAISGGSVQAYAGGGLEKISGTNGFNAGASSVQKIDGNSDGYVQFQWSSDSVRVGLKYSDIDFNVDSPYLEIDSTTNTIGTKSVTPGDWFRIRHYASTNEIKYQRKETVYGQNPNFVFETASGSNYNYLSASRPLVISLDGSGTLTIGELYEVYTVRASDQALYLKDLDGNAKGYHSQGLRGVRFEAVEEVGQDYVTFYTEPTLTNGNDLYVDVSLYHVGARINDVTIVT
jgi:hypothetical protein